MSNRTEKPNSEQVPLEKIVMPDEFDAAIETLTAMLVDYKTGGIDRQTLIRNLDVFIQKIAYEFYGYPMPLQTEKLFGSGKTDEEMTKEDWKLLYDFCKVFKILRA